jgi:D-inositol-3-phosphate glycosyltransferase
MKIIIIGPAHPLRGGLATFDERLARELQSEGDEVVIYTFSLQYPNFLFPGKTQYTTEPAPKDLNIKVAINSVNPFNWLMAARKIVKERPDFIICRFWLPIMGPALGSILRLIKRSHKVPIVGLIDNIIPHEKRMGDKPFAKYFAKAADSFLVMSQAVGEEMGHFAENKPIVYIPHPIYDNYGDRIDRKTALGHLKLSDDCRYILFFGLIRPYKGLDLLLEAMADTRFQHKNIRLVVAGEVYGDSEKYYQQIADLGIQDLVIMHTDFIPDAAVKSYFCTADLIVQPYKTATQSGISQIAYHFHKPMVVTNVGGLPEIVNNGLSGYVVETNPKSIANAILDFYENKKEASLVEMVIENKKRFEWSAMTAAFKNLGKRR